MKFNFIPYQLNSYYSDLKSNLKFADKNDEVNIYFAKQLPIIEILSFSIARIALYFFEQKLITIYITLTVETKYIERVIKLIEKELKRKTFVEEIDNGWLYTWKNKDEFLGLLKNEKENCLTLYFTLKEYNVFEEDYF